MTDIFGGSGFSNPECTNYRPVFSWFFPHPFAWIGCGILFLVEAVWIPAAGFSLEFGATGGNFAFAALLVLLAMGLSRKKMELLAITAFCLAFFIFFGKQANVLNYLAHAIGMPWADSKLAQLENAMGIDWLGILEVFNNNPEPAG